MLLNVLQKDKDRKEIKLVLVDKDIDMLMQMINFAHAFLREQPFTDFVKERKFVAELEDELMEKFVML